MSTVDLLVCGVCGDRAETLHLHRSQQRPLEQRLRVMGIYLLNTHALVTLVTVAAMLALMGFFTRLSFTLAKLAPASLLAGVFWSYFFVIVRSTARGEEDIPIPEFTDVFSDWLLPALRGMLACALVWLPLVLCLIFFMGWDAHAYREDLLHSFYFYTDGEFLAVPWKQWLKSPLLWVVGLTTLVYLPMGLMMGATEAPLMEMLNPMRGLRAIQRLGRDYVTVLQALLVLSLVQVVARVLGAEVRALHLGPVSLWLAELVELPAPLLMARVLGLLLYTRGDAIGYGAPHEYLVPVLPGAAPSTSLRVENLGVTGSPPAPSPEPHIQELDEAVRVRDIPRVLALYASLALPRFALTAEVHLFVGQAAASQQDHALAVRALEAAADVAPEGPLAPRALVLLARVLGERMREDTRSQEVYRYIVERYPDTDASRFARTRLPPTS